MYDANECGRLETVIEKIEAIERIAVQYQGVSEALMDETLAKPAVLMHLVAIAEQFERLKNNNAFELLSRFDKNDLKGAYDIRNFIAHDYEGINLAILESIVRDKLPQLLLRSRAIVSECFESGVTKPSS